MKPLLFAAAAAAYYFRDSLAAAFKTTPPAPAIVAAQTAAANAVASGASPGVVALVAQTAANAAARLIPPTIQADSPPYHDALTASASAATLQDLFSIQSFYRLQDSDYLLTISQWNWYRSQEGIGTITDDTEVGGNAIPASTYLKLRQSRGLINNPTTAPRSDLRRGGF